MLDFYRRGWNSSETLSLKGNNNIQKLSNEMLRGSVVLVEEERFIILEKPGRRGQSAF